MCVCERESKSRGREWGRDGGRERERESIAGSEVGVYMGANDLFEVAEKYKLQQE